MIITRNKKGSFYFIPKITLSLRAYISGDSLPVMHLPRAYLCTFPAAGKESPGIHALSIEFTHLCMPCILYHGQFPLALALATAINKLQGERFDQLGIYFWSPLFSHAAYVALSRCTNLQELFGQNDSKENDLDEIRNIVWKEGSKCTCRFFEKDREELIEKAWEGDFSLIIIMLLMVIDVKIMIIITLTLKITFLNFYNFSLNLEKASLSHYCWDGGEQRYK